MNNTTDRLEPAVLVCERCGKPHAEPDPVDVDLFIWHPPVDYRVGVSRSCLPCWLGVTDLIERDDGAEEP